MAASILSPSFSAKNQNLGNENFAARLHSVLTLPFPARLYQVEGLVKITSTKELRGALPLLLENIFGFHGETGWSLDTLTRSYNRTEFEIARRFFSPEGPLLKAIYALQSDPHLSYEFPMSCLPGGTRRTLEQGGIPAFFVNKLQASSAGRPVLSLGAFELYIFHFAHYLVNTQWVRSPVSWNNLQDYLYPNLVEDYLHYYLPLDKSALATRCPIPSPVRNQPVSPTHRYSRQPLSPHNGSPVSPRGSPHGSLLKASFNSSVPQSPYPTPPVLHADHGQAEIWRCDTVVQVFTEFWLNQNSMDTVHQGSCVTQQSIPMAYQHTDRYSYYGYDPFAYLFETKMPSSNQLRIIRQFIKFLHYFANSASPEIITSPYQQPTINPLDEFKRCVLQQLVQKKLYTFLRHAFDRWPLDMSFRLVLETWLSFIQPWRYVDVNLNTSRERLADTEEKQIDYRWYRFVQENLMFYTVLWQEFLPRLFRMDLKAPFSAYMLFRAVKVLSLPNLPMMIEQVERKLYECGPSFSHMSLNADLGGSFLPLEGNAVHTTLNQQLADLEMPGFVYEPMFGEITLLKVQQLLEQIQASRAEVTHMLEQTASRSTGGLFSWLSLSALFSDDQTLYGDHTVSEIKKRDVHLEQSTKKLCEIFRLPVPEGDYSLNSTGILSPDHGKSDSSNPDMEETEDGFQLSPLGRYQLVNGIRKFERYYEGDPAEHPIQSYENAALVRLLHSLCSFVNQRFGRQINSWCSRDDFRGRMACVYFAPPLLPDQQIQSPLSRQQAAKLSSPRLNLRFLANYRNLVTLFLTCLVMCYLFGFGKFGFMLFLIVVVLIYGFFKALLMPKHSRLKSQ